MELADLQSNPTAFRSALLIDTDAGPTPFHECMDAWQQRDFQALDSGWQRAAGQQIDGDCYGRAWLERPRGHAKTLDLAVMSTWALFASRRMLSGIGAAADLDQARLLRDAVGRLLYTNPWLSSILEVQNYRVINCRTQSTLDIISSDAPTSYGLTPDFVICDELVHWNRRDLWDSLISSAAKRAACMVVVITNAGMTDDWQWTTREAVRQDASWYFSRLDGPCASWISKAILDEQQRLLPGVAYRRLWLNEWSTGGGDALTAADIASAFNGRLHPQDHAARGYDYTAGLDLGISRDASAVCVLGIRRGHRDHGCIRLAYTKVWRPSKGKRVDLQQVEDTLVKLHEKFRFKRVSYDPWQGIHMASRLQSAGLGKLTTRRDKRTALPMVEVTPTGKNLQAVATAVIEAFADQRIELYPDADLRRDLSRLRCEERQYGFRLTSPRDATGHGDLATAFSLAMLAATELAATRKRARVGVGFGAGSENVGDECDDRPLWMKRHDAMVQEAELDAQNLQYRLEHADELGGVNHQLWYASHGARGRSPFSF